MKNNKKIDKHTRFEMTDSLKLRLIEVGLFNSVVIFLEADNETLTLFRFCGLVLLNAIFFICYFLIKRRLKRKGYLMDSKEFKKYIDERFFSNTDEDDYYTLN